MMPLKRDFLVCGCKGEVSQRCNACLRAALGVNPGQSSLGVLEPKVISS